MENDERVLYTKGCAAVLALCSRALLEEPANAIVTDVRVCGERLGLEFHQGLSEEELSQRFSDRFFVPVSPWYIPLREQCVRTAQIQGDRVVYGSVNGQYAVHVQECYQTVKFNWQDAAESSLRTGVLSADDLAVELAFLAACKSAEARGLSGGDAGYANDCARRFTEFARCHTRPFVQRAQQCLSMRERDFYAFVVDTVAAALEGMSGDE